MDLNVFFAWHPVFRVEELDIFLKERGKALNNGSADPAKRQALLTYHLKQGHILRLRQGLYATVPPGMDAKTYPTDSFLIASRLTPDAVLAYHTALSFLGVAHTIGEEFILLSEQQQTRPLKYRDTLYRATSPPAALSVKDRMAVGVEERNRQGLRVRVTGWERTLVDAFDRLSLVGGWNEAWRSLETIEVYLDIDFLMDYVLLLNEATTCAKVGYFLEEHRDRFSVTQRHLDRLKAQRPRQPHYVQRNKKASLRQGLSRDFIPEWNLWIPMEKSEHGSDFDKDLQV
jgi:predicted transcriptional regulator of viral defense system